MSREFKLNFFSSLLVVLLIVSNLICFKLTNFLDSTISVSFLTFPFTFLCTLLILNLGGKKAAYRSIIIAVLIQIFIQITYALAVNLGSQTIVPDMGSQVNDLFKINENNILASLASFLASHYALIYIYESFKSCKKELFGIAFGLLAALFLNTFIYQITTLYNQDFMYVINVLLSNIIVSLIMLIIITILYYILKEKEIDVVEIKDMNINVNNFKTNDLAIEDVILDKKASAVKTKKTTPKKQTNQTKRNYKTNTNKSTTKAKKTSTAVKKTSQVTKKKTNN